MNRNPGLFSFFLIMACCSGEAIRNSDQDYFPLHIGLFRIYDVDQTDISQTTCGDGGRTHSIYQIKEIFDDSVSNGSSGFNYIMHRFTRPDSTQAWLPSETWSSRVVNNQAITQEGNIDYVKLTFPLSLSQQWNGNQLNNNIIYCKDTTGSETYNIAWLGRGDTTASKLIFPFSVKVIQNNQTDPIVCYDVRLEIYAKGAGMIYKETTQLHYFTSPQPCGGQQKIQSGFIYKQSLRSYGKQ